MPCQESTLRVGENVRRGWKPAETFDTGIRKTVQWYLEHADWVANVQTGAYREWVQTQYAQEASVAVALGAVA